MRKSRWPLLAWTMMMALPSAAMAADEPNGPAKDPPAAKEAAPPPAPAPIALAFASAEPRVLTGMEYRLHASVTDGAPVKVKVTATFGALKLARGAAAEALGVSVSADGHTVVSAKEMTKDQLEALVAALRYVAPTVPGVSEKVKVMLGALSTEMAPVVEIGTGADCVRMTLAQPDEHTSRGPKSETYTNPTSIEVKAPQPAISSLKVRRQSVQERVEVWTWLQTAADEKSRCPTEPVEMSLVLTAKPDVDVLTCDEKECVRNSVRVVPSATATWGPVLRFAAAARTLEAETYDPVPGSSDPKGASIVTATLYASLVITAGGDPPGVEQVLIHAQPLTVTKLPSPRFPTAGFVTHPGAFALTVMQCSDILGSAAAAPGTAFGEFEQRCFESPGTITAVDSITVAPIGVHIRWNPTPRTPWFGIGVDLSALALGTSGNLTDQTTDDDHTGLWSPGLIMTGVDLELGRADAEVTRLNVLVGAGVAAVQADGSFRPRPFFGLTVMVPIATLDPNTPPTPTGEKP